MTDSAQETSSGNPIDLTVRLRTSRGRTSSKWTFQGAELQVLAGAMRTLGETEAVILEVTLFGTMISGPQFYNVVAFMKQYGFVAYDFCGFLYRPFDNALSQVDMVFAHKQGLFRRSHVFEAPEQRKVQISRR